MSGYCIGFVINFHFHALLLSLVSMERRETVYYTTVRPTAGAALLSVRRATTILNEGSLRVFKDNVIPSCHVWIEGGTLDLKLSGPIVKMW